MNREKFDALYRRGEECCREGFNQMQQRVLELEGQLKQKNSGGFRSAQGTKDFCDLRSVLSTVKKQAGNVMETIRNLVKGPMPIIDTSGHTSPPQASHLPIIAILVLISNLVCSSVCRYQIASNHGAMRKPA